MRGRTKNMTEGAPASLIFTFALPLMAGNVFQQLYTVVDTMVVGRFLGVGALAAVGASDWLSWMMLGIVQGFTQGFAIPMAQHFGAGHMDRLRQAVGGGAVLSAVLGLALAAFGLLGARPILLLLRTPADVLGGSLTYLRFLFSGLPIVMAFNLLACILRSLGDSRTPLQAMTVASLMNIALDLVFVITFRWGIAGAAAATVIAQGISALLCLRQVVKIDFLKLSRSDLRPSTALCRRLMTLGSPMAFQNCIIAVGGMIVQFVVNSFGMLFIAGFTATNKLYGVLEIAAGSYGYAMITYTGQNMGAGRIRRIRRGIRAALGIALATAAVIGLVMVLAGRYILGWFISGAPEDVAATMDVAYFYLAVMSVALPILYVLHVVRSTIQGLGNTVLPMASGIVEFLMRTGAALFLSRAMGQTGVYFAEPAAWLGADVVLVSSYLHLMKKLPPDREET